MSDKADIDLTSTFVLGDDDEVAEARTLELTGLVHQLTADLLSSDAEDDDPDEDEEEPEA